MCCNSEGYCGTSLLHCGVSSCIGGCSRHPANEYTGDHFWSNFEIADFSFFRSKQYQAYFDFLDKAGGFFYERWGDAPVHSLAVGMFLRLDQVHYFQDIGYKHSNLEHCPLIPDGCDLKCNCERVNGTWSQDLDKVKWFLGS